MIIVKRRSEVVRFLLFLAAVGMMAYYVTSRWEAWHLARGENQGIGETGLPAGMAGRQVGEAGRQVGEAGRSAGEAGPTNGQVGNAAGKGTADGQGGSSTGKTSSGLSALPHPAGTDAVEESASVSDFFAEFRMKREQSRSALRENLKEVMENPASGAETRERAGEQYLALGRQASLESEAEALVRARGFEDAVVHLSDGSAQVVVKAHTLTQQQAVQVVDTVSRVTGVKAGAVQVMARER